MQSQVMVVQFRGNRINQERHIVVNEFDNRMITPPTVFFGVRIENPDQRLAPGAGLALPPMPMGQREQGFGRAVLNIQWWYIGVIDNQETGKSVLKIFAQTPFSQGNYFSDEIGFLCLGVGWQVVLLILRFNQRPEFGKQYFRIYL